MDCNFNAFFVLVPLFFSLDRYPIVHINSQVIPPKEKKNKNLPSNLYVDNIICALKKIRGTIYQ